MIIYFLTFAFLTLLSLIESFINKSYFKVIIGILLIYLTILVGFRSDSFGDYCNYVISYVDTPNLIVFLQIYQDYHPIFEYGYEAISILTKTIIDHNIFNFLVIGGLSITISFFCIKKMSPYFFLSVLLFLSHAFILKELAQIRAGLASSIILLSIYFLVQGKSIKYFSIVLIASLFHFSAIITILGYFTSKIINIFSYQRLLYVFVLSLCLLSAIFSLHLYIIEFLVIQDLMPHRFYVYYADCPVEWGRSCANPNSTTNTSKIGILSNLTTIKYLGIVFMCLLYYNKLVKSSKFFNTVFIFYFIGLCWIIVFNDIGIFATRISAMFTVGEIILIPMIVKIIKPEILIKLFAIILTAIIFYININRQFSGSINPLYPSKAFYQGDYCPTIQNQWLHNRHLMLGLE